MTHCQRRLLMLCLFAACVRPASVAANDVTAEARQLYVDAFYERALSALDEAQTRTDLTDADEQAIRRYRTLCLIALDRSDEAVKVVDEMIRADPMTRPDTVDPPRLRYLISDARVRLLPDVVRERYARGRAAFERKEFAEATAAFGSVMQLLEDTGVGLRKDPALADLGLLTEGFLDLLKAHTQPAAPQPPAVASTSVQPPAVASTSVQPAVVSSTSLPEAPDAAPVDIVPPVVLDQRVPPWPNSLRKWLTKQQEGAVEVLVGADGAVQSATMVTPIHVAYDRLLLAAARNWKYRPALRNGAPVPYVRLVRIVISANTS